MYMHYAALKMGWTCIKNRPVYYIHMFVHIIYYEDNRLW